MGIGRTSNHWKVNGTSIYEPGYGTKVLHTSISSADTGRTEDGHMHNTWVIPDLIKISFMWKALTGNEVKTLIQLVQGKDFTLTYREFGTDHTAQVYVSEVNYTPVSSALFASDGGLCADISFNAIEK